MEVKAPFSEDQVSSLNGYQKADVMHPFTCANRGTHADIRGVLVATPDGWVCPQCDYTQDWAHDWMANWAWARMERNG